MDVLGLSLYKVCKCPCIMFSSICETSKKQNKFKKIKKASGIWHVKLFVKVLKLRYIEAKTSVTYLVGWGEPVM